MPHQEDGDKKHGQAPGEAAWEPQQAPVQRQQAQGPQEHGTSPLGQSGKGKRLLSAPYRGGVVMPEGIHAVIHAEAIQGDSC